jgi:RHS repeat-associated protein
VPQWYVRYSAYGVPELLRISDYDHSGTITSQDYFDFLTAFSQGFSTADINRDGVVNSADYYDFLSDFFSGDGEAGRGHVSPGSLGSSVGFGGAGYWWDRYLGMYHVRHRVYDPERGRWLQRDPIGYWAGGTSTSTVGGIRSTAWIRGGWTGLTTLSISLRALQIP